MPGALFLFLCLLCAIGIASYFFHLEPQPAVRQEEPRLVGTRDVVIGVGETLPDLKEGLGVNDAVEQVEIDTSAVDTGTAGEYPIIYRYIDVQGDTHEIRTTCTVTAAEKPKLSEEKNTDSEKLSAEQQEKDELLQGEQQEKGQLEDTKKTVRTMSPQTSDRTAFLGYTALFLVSVFLFLFVSLCRYFFE